MTDVHSQTVEAYANHVLEYVTGTGIGAMIFLGDQVGLYRAMDGTGPLTSRALAERAGLHPRWVQEWLHAQVCAGLLHYDPTHQTYELPAAGAQVLARETSPDFCVGGFHLIWPLLSNLERLKASMQSGLECPYHDLGAEHAHGEMRFSAPWMQHNLVQNILPGLDGMVARLQAGAEVVDVGCGSGRALIEMARAFPHSRFQGFDSAPIAIQRAQQAVQAAGLTNITLHLKPETALPPSPTFDFVLTWDCLHDMVDPQGAIQAIRRAIKPDGTWLIVDINGKDSYEENYQEPIYGMLYAISVLDCLAPATAEPDAAGLGTLGFHRAGGQRDGHQSGVYQPQAA
jgi:2-polyprenyl-3-methyl-5-hydroxy-6-metoxy-1,4-benzoquinol methylase